MLLTCRLITSTSTFDDTITWKDASFRNNYIGSVMKSNESFNFILWFVFELKIECANELKKMIGEGEMDR